MEIKINTNYYTYKKMNYNKNTQQDNTKNENKNWLKIVKY